METILTFENRNVVSSFSVTFKCRQIFMCPYCACQACFAQSAPARHLQTCAGTEILVQNTLRIPHNICRVLETLRAYRARCMQILILLQTVYRGSKLIEVNPWLVQSQWSVVWSTSHIPGMDTGTGGGPARRDSGRRRLRLGALIFGSFLTMHCRVTSSAITGGFCEYIYFTTYTTEQRPDFLKFTGSLLSLRKFSRATASTNRTFTGSR